MKYTKDEKLKGMRESGRILRRLFREVSKEIRPDITTNDLNEYAHTLMKKYGVIPAPLTVGFPKAICTSVNDVMIHGVPNEYRLKSNDLLSLDMSISLDGWFTDACRTYIVRDDKTLKKSLEIPEELCHLTNVAFMATEMAIDVVRPAITLYTLSAITESVVTNAPVRCSVVKNFYGHHIGRQLHEEPFIESYIDLNNINDHRLNIGDTFTIEPLVKLGSNTNFKVLEDGWSIQSVDGLPSAQHENTIIVTEDGYEVLT